MVNRITFCGSYIEKSKKFFFSRCQITMFDILVPQIDEKIIWKGLLR